MADNNEKTQEELDAEKKALEDAELLKNQQKEEEAARVLQELADAKADAEKWKTTADNYKREIETKGLRDKKRELPKVEASTVDYNDGQIVSIINDYNSKRRDVWDEVKEDFASLKPEEWAKVEHLVAPALDAAGSKALQEKEFASRVELKRALTDLVNYAKGGQSKVDTEKIRLEALAEKAKADAAEINGTKTTKKAKENKVTEEDEKKAENSGGLITPESAALIREHKAQIDKEYSEGIY